MSRVRNKVHYVARIWENGSNRVLGRFDNAYEAALCYAAHLERKQLAAQVRVEV